jgi:UDP-galactopyranose mutase
MYDIVVVGAGLTAATICALRKDKKILVVDTRHHIGGNCYDYMSGGAYIHKYGPHLFHSPNQDVVAFLSQFTNWVPYRHRVTAELEDGTRVPFPYSKETQKALGKELSQQEVIDIFFKPYSQKMWGKNWDDLPPQITERVPKNSNETSDYFKDQFTALPEMGYTRMIENMFQGTDILLGVGPDYWQTLNAKQIIYCGRPDHIRLRNGLKAGGVVNWLKYRNIKFDFKVENWDASTPVVNFCHLNSPYTRKSFFGNIFGAVSQSKLVLYETPEEAMACDIAPYYPIPCDANFETQISLKRMLQTEYPNLIFAGRLGTSSYIDMWQCVLMGMDIAKKL